MTNYTTFPYEAHNNSAVFVDHARNIGRAYRNQAMELIDICLFLPHFSPPLAHEDAELRRVLRACDLALRSAADSGKEETDEANERFQDATQVLSKYLKKFNASGSKDPTRPHYFLKHSVFTRMKRAKQEDSVQKGVHYRAKHEGGRTINLVLLPSPVAALHDPRTILVRQVLSARPSFSEILWNFTRYKDRARITLEQNPHFYFSLPENERTFTPTFRHHPLKNSRLAAKSLHTIYVLVGRPGRVFLENEREKRIFGNVWMLNGTLIFKDQTGTLEGEQIVRASSIKRNLRYCERPVVLPNSESRTWLKAWPIITTPSAGLGLALGGPLKDWTVLSHPVSCSNNIFIYQAQRLPGPSKHLGLPPPPPPASEQPEYPVLYTNIKTLNDDILLEVFNYYRLGNKIHWNVRLGWCKLSHVCRRWRDLVYESPFMLDMHLLCTNGSPMVDTLAHLPPLPLAINYQYATGIIGALDELRMFHALQLRNRVRHVVLHIPPSSLHQLFMPMDEPFPSLEHFSLSSTAEDTDLILPVTFLAPNLRHLTLSGIGLPEELTLFSLMTLTLTNIRASGYFPPRRLVTHLQLLPQLEELSIGFSDPLPRPSVEWELFRELLEPPVALPSLKRITFRGVGAYLESLVVQIRAPFLNQLDISLFNQVVFALPRLSHFTQAIQRLRLPIATVIFKDDAVSVVTTHRRQRQGDRPSSLGLRVMCKPFDWQIGSAAQICGALMPVLAAVDELRLEFDDGQEMPIEWRNGVIDGAAWHELLRLFVGMSKLGVCRALAWELSRALQLGDVGLDPEFLPALLVLVHGLEAEHTENAFASFIATRQLAGHSVRLAPPPMGTSPTPVYPSPSFVPISPSSLQPAGLALLRGRDSRPNWSNFGSPPYRTGSFGLPMSRERCFQYLNVVFAVSVFFGACSLRPLPYESRAVQGTPIQSDIQLKYDLPPPKHIRSRVLPSHRGAGSAWR